MNGYVARLLIEDNALPSFSATKHSTVLNAEHTSWQQIDLYLRGCPGPKSSVRRTR
jgi:hypothetical protein